MTRNQAHNKHAAVTDEISRKTRHLKNAAFAAAPIASF